MTPILSLAAILAANPAELPDLVLRPARGPAIQLSEWKGAPALVNFWATWCAPCREEMPAIERLAKERKGLRVLGLSIDAQGWPAVTPFLRQYSIGFPVALADRRVLRAFGFSEKPTLPQTFLFGADGRLLFKFDTALSEADLRRLVDRALAEAR